MKKIITVIFIILCLFTCYLIYEKTENDIEYYTSIGDTIGDNIYFKDDSYTYNNIFVDKDMRIKDLLNIIKYNEEKTLDRKNISIHQILKKTDILIISVGMNDIYYKLKDSKKEIYTYLNEMIYDYEELLTLINKYDYKFVYILGYYNIYDTNNDIYKYINYKLEKLANKFNYNYIDLDRLFKKMPDYYAAKTDFSLNNNGYKEIFNLIVEKNKYY